MVLAGLDLLDGTPVLDLKPYVTHFDSHPSARVPSWVQHADAKSRAAVEWSASALAFAARERTRSSRRVTPFDGWDDLAAALEDTLALDFRKAEQKRRDEVYIGELVFAGYTVRYEQHQDSDGEVAKVVIAALEPCTARVDHKSADANA